MTTPLPFKTEQLPFKSDLNGVFGTFKTDESSEIDFVLSSMPISRIEELETASQALDVRVARFADLIQRDIDLERVQEIVTNYLEKGKDRVIFFPPLLVSLVAFEEVPGPAGHTGIIELYSSIDDSDENGWAVRTWDKNRFQLRIPIASEETGARIERGGRQLPIYSYGSQLKWNPKLVKLVVIDGQHRLCALQHIYRDRERRHVVADIHVPICVVFSPQAVKNGSGEAENIRTTLRDLFVTINKTAQNVSGHFLVLLDDKSLSSLAVRDFAQAWKDDAGDGFSKLHLLEWNQRNKQRANQRTRAYSITTVSIVSDALERYVFSERNAGLTRAFLNLEERRDLLEDDADSNVVIDDISERNFNQSQAPLLQEQIRKYLTPSLQTLFGELSPYRRQAEDFKKALDWLHEQVRNGTLGAATYRDDILFHYRTRTTLDSPASEEIEEEFENRTQPAEKDSVFFLNVFQQGMIKAWVDLCRVLFVDDFSPAQVAQMMVAGLEVLCVDSAKSYFGTDSSYTRLALYREGGTTIVSEGAKDQWARLILTSFLHDGTWRAAAKVVAAAQPKGSTLKRRVREMAKRQYGEYLDSLRDATQRDLERNWRDRDLSAQQQQRLTELSEAEGARSQGLKDYVSQKLTAPRIQKATARLRSVLELSSED